MVAFQAADPGYTQSKMMRSIDGFVHCRSTVSEHATTLNQFTWLLIDAAIIVE
jgi:hypothetical protein